MTEDYEDTEDRKDGPNKSSIILALLLLGLLGTGAGLLWGRTRSGTQKQVAGADARKRKQEPGAQAGAPGGVSSGGEKILYLRLSGNEIVETDAAGAVQSSLWKGGPNDDPPDLLLDVAMQGFDRISLYPTGDARTGTYMAIRRKAEHVHIPLDEHQPHERVPSATERTGL